ncbi:MAG TPA: VOC family protein [Candidatus Binatia bacterium]|nr:VOC family protein [Candidatus Binatia bacterium]
MLNESEVVANVAVKDVKKAKQFYENTLGLEVVDDADFGVTFKSGATSRLFVYPTPMAGTAKSTCATWEVRDIKKVTNQLSSKGVEFEHYEFPGAEHEGPIHIMQGNRAAWFKDPDGNILGLSEITKQ